MIEPIRFLEIPKMDSWEIPKQDALVTNVRNLIIMPITNVLGCQSDTLDMFVIRPKKCYNSQVVRDHICLVDNYFEKYFDPDKELLMVIARIKYMIDNWAGYTKEAFIHDIRNYILCESIKQKVRKLADYNYALELSYKNLTASLQYTDEHAKTLLMMSIFMNFVIPLITHFANKNREPEIDEFIMDVYDDILTMYDTNIFSKLFETSYSNVSKSEYKNAPLWMKQDIRGKDSVTHSRDSVDNIILNIMPKYAFDRNIVALNYTSIQKNTSCQILDIGYEFGFVPLSSSKRDADSDNASSEFDKYEASILKTSEALAIQNQVNCEETMNTIRSQYGPFDPNEITFQRNRLKNAEGSFINGFQKQLIYNIFYKYFGDVEAIKSIQPATDYIEMMLAAKKILLENHMIIMPYVISAKVEKLVPRKSINKKEEKELLQSPYYPMLIDKYKSDKIINNILGTLATVISSSFRIIDYHNPAIDGKKIDTIPSIVMEELQLMTLLY